MDWEDLILEVRGLREDVMAIRQDIEHYRGFFAGVMWCFAAVSGAVGFVWGLLI